MKGAQGGVAEQMETTPKPKRIAKRRRSLSPAMKKAAAKSALPASGLSGAITPNDNISQPTSTPQNEPTLKTQPEQPEKIQEQGETPNKPKRVAKRRRTSVKPATPIPTSTVADPEPPSTPNNESEAKKRKREDADRDDEVQKREEEVNDGSEAHSEQLSSPAAETPNTRKRVAKRRRKLCKEQLPALDEEMDRAAEEEEESFDYKSVALPSHYLELKEIFQALDMVCDYVLKRQGICAFETVKESVETMTKRNFSVRHLAQIKTIWAEAYVFQLDKQHNAYTEKYEYRLLIHPQGATSANDHAKTIGERRDHFHQNLVVFFKKALEEARMCGESVAPEIPQAFLPQPEKEIELKEQHAATPMKRKLRRRQDSPIASPSSIRKKGAAGASSLQQALMKKRLEESLKTVKKEQEKQEKKKKVEEKEEEEEEEEEDEAEKENKKAKTEELRQQIRKELNSRTSNIAPEIVEKVRRKEEQKLLDEKTGAAEMRRRQDLLSTLPLLCDMLRSFFVSDKKWCLELGYISKKLVSAYVQGHGQTVGDEDMMTRLHVLCQVVPQWVEIKEYSKKERYLKLNKNANFNTTKDKVAEAVKKGFHFTFPAPTKS